MKKLLMMLAMAALLAGCADQAKKEEAGAAVEERKVTETKPEAPPTPSGAAAEKGAGARELPPPGPAVTSPLTDPKNILSKRSVYFDYDSNVVKEEFRPLVEAHARYLVLNGKAKVIIQGNADERGSREYNIGLGQRRADAVKKAMGLLGVPESRIETVSFGEEKPKATGSNEEAWAQNRRADIVYEGE